MLLSFPLSTYPLFTTRLDVIWLTVVLDRYVSEVILDVELVDLQGPLHEHLTVPPLLFPRYAHRGLFLDADPLLLDLLIVHGLVEL